MTVNQLSEKVIGLCIEIHRNLGPGLLESVYEECLCYELSKTGIPFERQKPVSVKYKEVNLDCGFRIDVLVDQQLIVELKSVEKVFADSRGTNYYIFKNCRYARRTFN